MNLETISVFIQKLVNLAGLCSFDDEFHALYRHNQDLLLALNKNQWIDIYARRRDIINQYHRQWTVELLPLNLLWFELGRLVASDFHIPILDLMCPNEPIYQKDREYVEQHDYFILDLFKDDKGYLRSFNYYFLMLMKGQGDVYGHLYKMSLLEAEQNKNKRRWSTLCREEMSYIWEDPTAENLFKDSAYPLFDCIKTYFTSPLSELSQGQIRTLILALYSNELIYLDRITVNAFYAQKLRIDNEIELRMIEVLLICMEERPAISLLPYMLAIAHWVAKFNPSMVIGVHELDTRFNDCPDVLDDIYRVHRIGPYWRERIPKEVHGLSQFIDANKLMSGIKEKLLRLSDLLSAPPAESNDRMIFDQMQIINLDFDNFNGINRPVVYNGLGYKISKDFVYDRDGINEQLILINQILSGAGFLSRYGIQCYYRYMMGLASDYDAVSLTLYSSYPLSHCVRPVDDRSYLAVLDHSAHVFSSSYIFQNQNASPLRPFYQNEYDHIQRFSAKKFQNPDYVRIPNYVLPPIQRSTLRLLTWVVNQSLDYKGLVDGYTKIDVQIFPDYDKHEQDKIYVSRSLSSEYLEYSVLDRWPFQSRARLFTGIIPLKMGSIHYDRLLSEADKLAYITRYIGRFNHVRPSYGKDKFASAAYAYAVLKEHINALTLEQREALFDTWVSWRGEAVRIGKLWADGNPDCMTYTSKGFVVLLLNYMPDLKFSESIENQFKTHDNDFLNKQRAYAVERKMQRISRGQMDEIIDDSAHEQRQVFGSFAALSTDYQCSFFSSEPNQISMNFSRERQGLDSVSKRYLLNPEEPPSELDRNSPRV